MKKVVLWSEADDDSLSLSRQLFITEEGASAAHTPYIYKNPCHFTPSKKRKKKQLEQYHRRSSLLNICCCCLFSPSPKQQQQQQMDLGNLASPGWPSVCVCSPCCISKRDTSQKNVGTPKSPSANQLLDGRERALNLITQSKAINIVRVLVFFSVLFSFSLPQTECDSVCREEEEEDKIEKQNKKRPVPFYWPPDRSTTHRIDTHRHPA